jgi:hypothetical protein
MQYRLAVLALAALVPAMAPATPTQVIGTLTDDQYNYWSVSDGGTRDRAAVFSFVQAPPPAPQFFFDYHDGVMIAKWTITLPPALIGQPLEVTSARIEVFNRKDAEWNPATGQVRLFAAGFTGNNGFNESTWTESTGYFGPTAFVPGARDPFPRDLNTNLSAANNPSGTPWALGTVNPAEYTGVPANDPDEAFRITFDLDTNNSTIQNELLADIAAGVSSWIIASSYAAAQPPAPAVYPEIITKEGLTNPAYGTVQQAPRLILEVQVTASTTDWELLD